MEAQPSVAASESRQARGGDEREDRVGVDGQKVFAPGEKADAWVEPVLCCFLSAHELDAFLKAEFGRATPGSGTTTAGTAGNHRSNALVHGTSNQGLFSIPGMPANADLHWGNVWKCEKIIEGSTAYPGAAG